MSIRITNNTEAGSTVTKIQYVDRIVQAPAPEPIIQYMTKEVPVDRIVEKLVVADQQDLQPLHDKDNELELKLKSVIGQVAQITNNIVDTNNSIISELEMQRRALVGLKQQRDIDRSRRLMLIKRMKKEHIEHKKTTYQLRWTIAASLLLSFISLFIKL